MDHYRGRKPSWSTHNEPKRSVGERLRNSVLCITTSIQYSIRQARRFTAAFAERPNSKSRGALRWASRHILTPSNILILFWLFVLYRCEYSVFSKSISECDWASWERWPDHATPHHIAIITDPQLIDSHTYPGRPWPLSTLTIKHTDLYLRRSYSRIQRDLDPRTVLFLGDLFDGGREWSTAYSQSPEERWHRYGNEYWVKEYRRFGRIFFTDWTKSNDTPLSYERNTSRPHVLASLPGNHDLGFGAGIQLPVRDRFEAFFGESNRIDIIGNHTFVSVDSPSLSAEEHESTDDNIWYPVSEFLHGARDNIREELDKHVKHLGEQPGDISLRQHVVEDTAEDLPEQEPSTKDVSRSADFPTVLLTHIPLYRSQGTPCGPLRERHPPTPPPSGQTEPVDPDNPNSLTIDHGWGYQYQNFVSQRSSTFILESLGGTVGYVFSGDDHDYCEVVHKGYPSPGKGVREITVKSISWAMGVRRPGFLLASLWNEIDHDGRRIPRPDGEDAETIQTHLCLLPDQLAIFIRYAFLFGLTLVVITGQAVHAVFGTPKSGDQGQDLPLLPVFGGSVSSAEREKANGNGYARPSANGNASWGADSSSRPNQSGDGLSVTRGRSGTQTRPRSISPMPTYGYGIGNAALDSGDTHHYANGARNGAAKQPDNDWKDRQRVKMFEPDDLQGRSRSKAVFNETLRGLWRLARIVLPWYIWLLYY